MSSKWRPLQDGDVVDIIAPGFPTDAAVVKKAISFLKSWGLRPRVPKNLQKKTLLFSNVDDVRWEHLKKALSARDSKVVWCLRGGYGSLRLLPRLDKMSKPRQAKLLIGISDVTSLSVYLNERWKWPVLHGALLDRLGKGEVPAAIVKEMGKILRGEQKQVSFKNLKPMNTAARKVKRIKAPIIGGNLVTLQAAIGTPFDFNLKNKILFIEELGERGYRIDRILVHLAQVDRFRNCKAVILGHFIGGSEPSGGNNVKKVLAAWALEQKFPVFSGLESGHDVKLRSLPLGTSAVLQKKAGYELLVETGVRAL